MEDLMSVYENMYGETEVTKEASEGETSPEVEIFQKYASLAENALAEEYGEDFDANDVEKLASMMIEHDLEQEIMQEKVAEYVQAGTIMAKAFKAELDSE